MKRHIAVLLSDPHAGHMAGLCNPETEIVDLQTGKTRRPNLTPLMEQVWEWFVEDAAAVAEFAGHDPVTLIQVGDPTQGNARTDSLAEVSLNAQLSIAKANLEPFRNLNLEAYVQVSGTSWHDFGDSSTPALLTKWVSETWPSVRVIGHHHPLVNVGGAVLDISHHGPASGTRKWVEGNALHAHVRDRMLRDLERGLKPPAVYAYGHVHVRRIEPVWVEFGHEYYCTWGVICPPYCLPGAYGLQAGQSPPFVGVGLVLFEVLDGRLGAPVLPYHEFEMRRKPDAS